MDLVILPLPGSAELLRHGKFSQGFTLPHSLAVVAYGLVFIFQINRSICLGYQEVRTG